jgi:hypothetical protein
VRMHTLSVFIFLFAGRGGWTQESGGGASRQVWTSSYVVRFTRFTQY